MIEYAPSTAYPEVIEFKVDEEDIVLGAPSSIHCPISRAINRALSLRHNLHPYLVRTTQSYVTIYVSDRCQKVVYEHDYHGFVTRFDCALPVDAFDGKAKAKAAF